MRRSPRISLTHLAVIVALAVGLLVLGHSAAELGHALTAVPVAQGTP